MAETKYGKYIITSPKPGVEEEAGRDGPDVMTSMVYIDDKVLEGAFYLECYWVHKPTRFSPPVHTHEFDEILSFYGSDTDNPRDLGGEVELWIDGEKHLIDKSCSVYIPKGTQHCPMIFRRVDRPIFHFSTGTSGKYNKDLGLVATE